MAKPSVGQRQAHERRMRAAFWRRNLALDERNGRVLSSIKTPPSSDPEKANPNPCQANAQPPHNSGQ